MTESQLLPVETSNTLEPVSKSGGVLSTSEHCPSDRKKRTSVQPSCSTHSDQITPSRRDRKISDGPEKTSWRIFICIDENSCEALLHSLKSTLLHPFGWRFSLCDKTTQLCTQLCVWGGRGSSNPCSWAAQPKPQGQANTQ